MQKIIFIISIISVILLSIFITTVIPHFFNVSSTIYNIVALILTIYVLLYLLRIIKVKHFEHYHILDKKMTKNILTFTFLLFLIFITIEYFYDTILVANIVISLMIGFYAGDINRKIERYYTNKKNKRNDIIAEKYYNMISDYMNRNGYYMIGDINKNDIYQIKINFHVKHADKIVNFLQYLVSNPNKAYLTTRIFNHIDINDDGSVLLDGEVITNPSKLGLFILQKIDEKNYDVTVDLTDD